MQMAAVHSGQQSSSLWEHQEPGRALSRPRCRLHALDGGSALTRSLPLLPFIDSLHCAVRAKLDSARSGVCISQLTEGHTDAVQDTVAGGGRRGTRPQCVAAARAALLAGQGAIIDRCNWNIPQRMDFTALAKEMGCQVRLLRQA